MKCPHCLDSFHSTSTRVFEDDDVDGRWRIYSEKCPACQRLILSLERFCLNDLARYELASTEFLRPRATQRPQPDPAVPSPFRDDYVEACAVFPFSAKASAALTRRVLQGMLREKGSFCQKDLADQIEGALNSGKLPSHIAESLDAVRNIGNFAAHPQKSKTSGELLDVEPGEAEWNLDVIESLFDYYFVQPELTKKRRAALDAKLAKAGKPPVK